MTNHVNPGCDVTVDPRPPIDDSFRSTTKTPTDQIKENFEPWELLDMMCWADIVLHVQFSKSAEDVGFCKGESCNYCGKFNKESEQREGERE